MSTGLSKPVFNFTAWRNTYSTFLQCSSECFPWLICQITLPQQLYLSRVQIFFSVSLTAQWSVKSPTGLRSALSIKTAKNPKPPQNRTMIWEYDITLGTLGYENSLFGFLLFLQSHIYNYIQILPIYNKVSIACLLYTWVSSTHSILQPCPVTLHPHHSLFDQCRLFDF